MPTIYYIRHGETDWNATGRFQGSRDIPLNDRGRAQAAHAGRVLGELLARRGIAADALAYIASPLGRARATMELVRTSLGLAAAGYAVEERLREVSYGRWEGLTSTQMQTADPDHFAAREADKWRIAAPGGESYADMAVRIVQWLQAVTRDVVVVGHVGTGRALMASLGNVLPDEVAGLKIEQGAVYVFGDGGVETVR